MYYPLCNSVEITRKVWFLDLLQWKSIAIVVMLSIYKAISTRQSLLLGWYQFTVSYYEHPLPVSGIFNPWAIVAIFDCGSIYTYNGSGKSLAWLKRQMTAISALEREQCCHIYTFTRAAAIFGGGRYGQDCYLATAPLLSRSPPAICWAPLTHILPASSFRSYTWYPPSQTDKEANGCHIFKRNP